MTDVTMNGPVVTSIVATGQHAMQHNKSITITPSSKPPKNTPIYKCYATNIDSRLVVSLSLLLAPHHCRTQLIQLNERGELGPKWLRLDLNRTLPLFLQ